MLKSIRKQLLNKVMLNFIYVLNGSSLIIIKNSEISMHANINICKETNFSKKIIVRIKISYLIRSI